jgi:transposase
MVLSIEERVFLVEYVFRESNRYTDLVQEEFAEKFPETPVPHRSAVCRLIEKFHETGSVLDAERSGRPSKLNDTKLIDISDSMLRSPSKSLYRHSWTPLPTPFVSTFKTQICRKCWRIKLNGFRPV